MRPVLSNPPLCTYKELQDGTYSLTDIGAMNDALDVKAENEARAHEAAKAQERR